MPDDNVVHGPWKPDPKLKVMLLWLRKRSRKPLWQGLATAHGSAKTIDTFVKMASEGQGSLYIVEAENVAKAREMIAQHRTGKGGAGMKTVVPMDNGREVACLGLLACMALAGAADAMRKWEGRFYAQGKLTIEQTKALPKSVTDRMAAWGLGTAFGQGLGGE